MSLVITTPRDLGIILIWLQNNNNNKKDLWSTESLPGTMDTYLCMDMFTFPQMCA